MKDRIAFVTGAGGGIGREIAISLAKQKVNIVLFGGKDAEKLQSTAEMVRAFGVKTWVYPGDLTDDKVLNENFQKAISQVGKIDILINNAGRAYNKPFESTETEVFDKIMALNARVPFLLIKHCLPYLKKSDRASIINVASIVAHNGYPFQCAYTASKHALLGLTKSLANEVYNQGIRVHAVSPGGVYTDMIKVARPDLDGEDMIKPQEIADIIMFLLKNRGNAVIDEIIVHRVNKQPFLA